LNLTSEELPDESLLSIAARQYQLEPRDAWETWPAASDLPRYLVRPETITAQAFWLRLEQLPEPRELEQERTIRLTDISEQITSRADIRKFHNTLVHKLNTPLSGIWGGASLLKKHVGEGKEDGIAELAYLIENSASRLHQAIDDVINYTAASNLAHQGCYFQYAALSDLFREKATELKIATPHLLMPPQLTELASGLSDKAMQVIVFELLENAKKFHPTHTPTVSVTVEQQADEYVTINIRDDGINLSPNQLKWAMIPYVQGEKYFTGELDGMGLGLPVVSTLVWQSGGSISLHNRSDRPGLEVKLSLPVV
jgi:K+-sensing histidine kinase KdpD